MLVRRSDVGVANRSFVEYGSDLERGQDARMLKIKMNSRSKERST